MVPFAYIAKPGIAADEFSFVIAMKNGQEMTMESYGAEFFGTGCHINPAASFLFTWSVSPWPIRP